MNTYREAVRARILHGLLGLAVGTCGYALVVGAYALRNESKVVSDLGAASVSLYAIIVAIVIGGTSLYRELELKTIFPILSRPIERWEYLVGKFLGTLVTLLVFICLNSGLLLFAVGSLDEEKLPMALGIPATLIAIALGIGVKVPRLRSTLPIPVGVLLLVSGAWFAKDSVSESGVILGQALLTSFEVAIVAALTILFASFSSPFLTAVFTFCVFLVGRSAETLANLPAHVFGEGVKELGAFLSHVFPNLMVYVPPRAVLTGESIGVTYWDYTLWAGAQSLAWTVGLLAISSIIFRRRDFL